MKGQILAGVSAALAIAAPAIAKSAIDFDGDARDVSGGGSAQLPQVLQCVPYARKVSGVKLYGDAWTWWDQAAGRYERGFRPRVGAVLAFKPHGNMRLGHVAAVSRIIDSRTILIRHANWSPINGRRGQIEDNVRAIDVSEDNDWSEVRVWYDPIQDLGGTRWPISGFIYNRPAKRLDDGSVLARVQQRKAQPAARSTVQLARADRRENGRIQPASYARSADPIGEIIAARSAGTRVAARNDSRRFD